jgi:transcriptional regulator with XRE-family HTH domain
MTSVAGNQERGELSSGPIGDTDAFAKIGAASKQAMGDRIRHARVEAGLRQYEIAERAGVSRSAVSAWELGQGISSNKLVQFAKIVGVSAEWLITGAKDLETRTARAADFDPEQLELLMTAAFELLGKPEVQSLELAKAILKAAERPRSDDQELPNRALKRRFADLLVRMYGS